MKRLLLTMLVASSAPLGAQTIEAEKITIGDDTTQPIDTNLDGHGVPADIGQVFIGNTAESADAITIDSGSNFPPGIAFRRYLGDPAAPQAVTAGTQLGYLDFRGYSGSQFFNAGSLDVVVDGSIPFADGELPPTKMRFATSDGQGVKYGMELTGSGRLEIGAIGADSYYGPGALGDPKLYVTVNKGEWSTIFASRNASGPNNVLRLHSLGNSAADTLLSATAGDGTGAVMFAVRGNGDTYVAGKLMLGTQDVGASLETLTTRLDATDTRIDGLDDRLTNLSTTSAANEKELAAIAFGSEGAASASGDGALAIGNGATAASSLSTAIGQNTAATGRDSIALGTDSRGNGTSSVGVGARSLSAGLNATTIGADTLSTGDNTTAVGAQAKALRENSSALGFKALAQGAGAVSVGYAAATTGANATALGSGAQALQDGSTAIGAGAKTTAVNQVTLGGGGSSVRVGDIDASTQAQVGPVDVVTVDRDGTLGRQRTVTTAQLETVRTSMIGALAVSDAQFGALADRVQNIEGQLSELFDRAASQTKETRQGLAAVTALAQPHFPSASGRTSYASNLGYYRGEVGFSAGLMHRLKGDVAVTASVSYASGQNTAARVGVAGEF